MSTYMQIPNDFHVGGTGDVGISDLFGIVTAPALNLPIDDAVDVATFPGYVSVRSSRIYHERQDARRAARADLTPGAARELAALLLEAAALVEEGVGLDATR